MVREQLIQEEGIRLALRARDEAGRVLDRLISDRRMCEQQHADAGRRDPLKRLTGRSALDRAIASTREVIRSLDCLLNDWNEPDLDAQACRSRRPASPVAAGGAIRTAGECVART